MIYINQTTGQYYIGSAMPDGAGWAACSNEEWNALIAGGWTPTLYVPPYRVSKDTICSRVLDAGKLPDLMTLIDGLPPEQQFLWDNYAWFWNNNPTVNAMCAQLGLDPAVILAPDPYLI
jgi:hypothetical protein